MAEEPYNERHPFGKDATRITPDNITMAKADRTARNAILQGIATPEQHALVTERERMYKRAMGI